MIIPTLAQVLHAAQLVQASRDCVMAIKHRAVTSDMVRACLVRHFNNETVCGATVTQHMRVLFAPLVTAQHSSVAGYWVVQ